MASGDTSHAAGLERGDALTGDRNPVLVVGISADQFATLPPFPGESPEREHADEVVVERPVAREAGPMDAGYGRNPGRR